MKVVGVSTNRIYNEINVSFVVNIVATDVITSLGSSKFCGGTSFDNRNINVEGLSS